MRCSLILMVSPLPVVVAGVGELDSETFCALTRDDGFGRLLDYRVGARHNPTQAALAVAFHLQLVRLPRTAT